MSKGRDVGVEVGQVGRGGESGRGAIGVGGEGRNVGRWHPPGVLVPPGPFLPECSSPAGAGSSNPRYWFWIPPG